MQLIKALHSRIPDTMEREQLPLTAEGFHQFNQAAHEHENTEFRVSGQALIHLGIRNQELGHMEEDWLEDGPHGLQVRIPRRTKCWKDGGCQECRDDDNGAPPGFWSPKTDHGARVIPVPSDYQNHYLDEREEIELPSLLRSWLKLNGPMAMSRNKVRHIVYKLAQETKIHELQGRGLVERTISRDPELYPDIYVHDLRGSWACQCIRSECNRFRVRDWGGWGDVSMLNKYVRFVGGGNGEDRIKY